MSKIESGCTAIVVKSEGTENMGKIVKVGLFIGSIEGFYGSDFWEVSQPMLTDRNRYVNFTNESRIQRLDHHEDSQTIKTKQELTLESV